MMSMVDKKPTGNSENNSGTHQRNYGAVCGGKSVSGFKKLLPRSQVTVLVAAGA